MLKQIAICSLIVTATVGNAGGTELTNPFFAFDNGVGRGAWTIEQQAETLSELGYAGIGYSGVEDLSARLEAFESRQMHVFNLYVACYVDREEAYAPELAKAIEQLKGTNVIIWLTVQGKAENDERAVKAVRELAGLAAESAIKIALYPHYGFYVATLDDALRVQQQVDRDNVGVTFNLCHELRSNNEPRFDELLEKAAPHLLLVSINGADHAGDWDTLIQPLDQGEFDVCALLRKLLQIGYAGPIGLQCYNVPGDTRENLARNMKQWEAFQQCIREASP